MRMNTICAFKHLNRDTQECYMNKCWQLQFNKNSFYCILVILSLAKMFIYFIEISNLIVCLNLMYNMNVSWS